MSSRGLALACPAKNVVVYRNGDPFFRGRKFVVNQRHFLTFEAFLNEVTRSIHAPLAVRNLYTPKHGHRVAELADLQDGCQYVAAGFEKFKRLDYLNHGRKELRGTSKSNGVQTCAVPPWKPNTAVRQQKPTHLTIQLCRLDGTLVSSGEELVNGSYYVAVGTEEYKKLPYMELLVPSVCRTLWNGVQANHKALSKGKGMTTVLKMRSTE
ncbi:doublecortin domain-containing protein 2B isoform X4 [Coturnix japonica]|uniref:doublecortin domain-containing protein 2B isoform X4 n=1 Tax=Coturnix japonica TaxID=93934 RepID=UPI0007772174|nr:doublecortin domain-containing protein 2B isoform X4 [Coturnix japonica]